MIIAFTEDQRAQGHAVESICRVLRQQGLQIAARTYRAWRRANQPVAERTVSDAVVIDAIRDIAWTRNAHGERVMAPEGLHRRRKMLAYMRRTVVPDASAGAVDRGMRTLDLEGVWRAKKVRTTIPAADGKRAG